MPQNEIALALLMFGTVALGWGIVGLIKEREQDRLERAEMDRRLDQIDRLMDDLGVKRQRDLAEETLTRVETERLEAWEAALTYWEAWQDAARCEVLGVQTKEGRSR